MKAGASADILLYDHDVTLRVYCCCLRSSAVLNLARIATATFRMVQTKMIQYLNNPFLKMLNNESSWWTIRNSHSIARPHRKKNKVVLGDSS